MHATCSYSAAVARSFVWRRCDMLCTSDFVNDVMFAHEQARRKLAYPLKVSLLALWQHGFDIDLELTRWLGSRVVSVLRAGLRSRRAWVQIAAATLSGNSLRQTVNTHHASVHQAAKLVAALLRGCEGNCEPDRK